MPWSWWIPAAGVIVGLGASLLGSLLPLLELSRVDPVLTLRGRSGNRESRRWAGRVALAGVFILVASIIVLAFFSKQIYVAYIGVFGFLFGLSLLTGVIMVLAHPLLRRLLGGMGKLPGRIAAGNIIQNLGRTGVAVAAFMVALSLSIGLGSMIGSFRESLIWWMGSAAARRHVHLQRLGHGGARGLLRGDPVHPRDRRRRHLPQGARPVPRPHGARGRHQGRCPPALRPFRLGRRRR